MRQDRKVKRLRQDKRVKRVLAISWWKAISGAALIGVGLIFGAIYFADIKNMFAGVIAVFFIGPGILLTYTGLKQGESGFAFNAKGQKYTGRENAIVLIAERKEGMQKDIPIMIKFVELENPPKGARLHYVRNLKKHCYELFNNTKTNELEPVRLPDKKSFPPELYKIPATMQPYKDYMDYSPPTLLQKVAPGILLLAMGIVGLLMLVTGG